MCSVNNVNFDLTLCAPTFVHAFNYLAVTRGEEWRTPRVLVPCGSIRSPMSLIVCGVIVCRYRQSDLTTLRAPLYNTDDDSS